ncbi:divalent metal cation transporter [Longimicrobium sp.]|uniref:NRAMP family divalent metal transporter n=1 Tax=Longimicrobium sp. TaxID=2029185 RepID=UPI002E36F20A|nr:divalent metal cation transporter [Longimicrobium sp.]HEX6037230.1 divalent metal cation transporter [Longimicrobium sp.]
MKRFLQVLFWSLIPAAFIGPGTVTTCASAGATFGYALLWSLTFSTIATVVLQEASARVTVVSGRNLAEAIRDRFRGGALGVLVTLLVLGAIVLGNAAYEAGNVLGASAGAALGSPISARSATLLIALASAAVLWIGTPKTVTTVLAATVGFMGIAFLATAFLLKPPAGEVLAGSIVPSVPAGSGLLLLGLVGTTVVPYNLFLGSAAARGQDLGEIRFGLTVAVILGGLISMGILIAGADVEGTFSYEAVSGTLSARLGGWAGPLFAWGLFAAGFSSAITAPLAAAVTAQSLFGAEGSHRWNARGWRYRAVWMGVLAVGVGFGLAGVRPIPAIILAQALNGVVLPFAAVFLLLVVNDRGLMGDAGINRPATNVVTAAVVAVTLVLGVSGVLRAGASVIGGTPTEGQILGTAGVIAAVLLVPLLMAVRRARRAPASISLAAAPALPR